MQNDKQNQKHDTRHESIQILTRSLQKGIDDMKDDLAKYSTEAKELEKLAPKMKSKPLHSKDCSEKLYYLVNQTQRKNMW